MVRKKYGNGTATVQLGVTVGRIWGVRLTLGVGGGGGGDRYKVE
jgi:hypothetical protein